MDNLINLFTEANEQKVSKYVLSYQEQYITRIKAAIITLMDYYFNDSNINKVAHYAFSDEKVLRDSYMALQNKYANASKQLSYKIESSVDLCAFGQEYLELRRKCGTAMKTCFNANDSFVTLIQPHSDLNDIQAQKSYHLSLQKEQFH